MHLGAELSGYLLIDRIVGRGRCQLPEITLANSKGDVAAHIREFGHVERVTAEGNQRRIAFARLETFEVAVFKHEERAPLVSKHRAMVRDDADPLRGIAPVVDENAYQHPAG